MMPKAPVAPTLPLQGLFPIAKPSGPTSMKVIDSITPLLVDSKLFYDPSRIRAPEGHKRKKNTTHLGLKIGQGGTLDPLADGVLVIGVNRGTKHLNQFLECTKEYESTGLLGAATTTFDSEGPILSTAPFDHITREDIEKVLDKFRGSITQVPPIFSALKMDGKPLYEYARESLPLPRAIPTRKCEVSIDLIDFQPASETPGDGGHHYQWPKDRLVPGERMVFQRLTEMVNQVSEDSAAPAMPKIAAEDVPETSASGKRPAAFTVRMTVSSGTYVRSIVHDIGLALGCAAHVVTLRRTRQGQFTLFGDEKELVAAPSTVAATPTSVNGQEPAEASSSTAVPPPSSLDEEEALNATISPNPPTATTGPNSAAIAAVMTMDEEEAVQNSAVDLPPAPSSSSCIPWSVWEKAIKEREQELSIFESMRKEALDKGEPPSSWTREAIAAKRRLLPLREWEHELLRRFVSVPLPYHGWQRDHDRI